jgi:L-arabinose isomerase
MKRARLALVSAYFTLFDEQMPADFRARQEKAFGERADWLARDFDLAVVTGLMTTNAEGATANRLIRESAVDVVVVAPAMAAPPSYVAAALSGVKAPIVIWNAPLADRLGADLDQASAHEHTTLVGAVMISNVIAREGRSFHAVTAAIGDPNACSRLRRTIVALAAANTLRGRTALRIGDPVEGYLDVEASGADLDLLGVDEVAIAREELEREFETAGREELAAVRDRLDTKGWHGRPDERALRLAVALQRLVDRHQPLCGTVNCHSDLLRRNPKIGIPACLGMSLCSAEGVPFSCTGDQTAALCLALARSISSGALYCEFYTDEIATGLLLIANGGEGGAELAKDGVRIGPSSHYPGVNGGGSALDFELRTGPVTVLSLTPLSGTWRLIWAPGEIVEVRYPRLRAPNGMFAFRSDGGEPGDGASRWIESGATHHNVLVPDHLDLEIPLLAEALGIEELEV